jgi:hypothetical protein
MDRDELARALTDGSAAHEACRKELLAGAEFVVWSGTIPANELASSYRRRERFMSQSGIPTLGFAAAVERLSDAGSRELRLGQIEGVDPPYLYLVFLDATETRVVACLGVAELDGARPHQ